MSGQSLRKRSIIALLITSLAIGGGLTPLDGGVPVARADTLTVCPSGCEYASIQSAITNGSPGDTIAIGAGTYYERLTLPYNMTLTGVGAGSAIIDGSSGGTVVTVNAGLTVNMSGLTIQHGSVTGAQGASGAPGGTGAGGGISNAGTLAISNSAISGNTASGGQGGSVPAATGLPGGDGDGGGIYNVGALTLMSTTVSGNFASGGYGGYVYTYSSSDITGGNGGGGNGGGIYNGGTLTLTNSTVSTNTATGGQGGEADDYCCGGSATGGTGGSGAGAGIYNSGTLIATTSAAMGNTATGGFGGYCYSTCSGTGGSGGPGQGAGIYDAGSSVTSLTASTVGNNVATGGIGNYYNASSVGGDGIGGGVYTAGTLTLTNATLSANTATGGAGSGAGGNGSGGAIYAAGAVTAANATVGNNSASGGTGGTSTSNGAGSGGGIDVASAGVTVQNTIVGRNAATTQGPDCLGTLTSNGYNLLANSANCNGLTNVGDQTNVNPRLASLQDNGGPTWTMALLASSPAINAGNPTGCADFQGHLLTTDQRGMPRPDVVSGRCDIGAYEVESAAPPTNTPTPTTTPVLPTATPTNTPVVPTNTPSSTPIPPTYTPTATPTPTARLAVHPTSGVYGQRITLIGAHFGLTETVSIFGDRTGGTPIYTAHTDASGAFTLTATVLAGPYGPHTLIAIGQSSGSTARTTFFIKPRLVLRPTAGAPGTTTRVTGYGFGATEKVTVRWNTATGPLLATATSTASGSLSTTFTVPVSKRGGYLVYGAGQRTRATAAALFTVM